MSEKDTARYIPLEILREDRISFPSNGRNLSVKQASAEDFFAFIAGGVNVVNVTNWSIFMRWNAINIGLEAGTLIASKAGENTYTLALAEVGAEDFSEEIISDKSASQAS